MYDVNMIIKFVYEVIFLIANLHFIVGTKDLDPKKLRVCYLILIAAWIVMIIDTIFSKNVTSRCNVSQSNEN